MKYASDDAVSAERSATDSLLAHLSDAAIATISGLKVFERGRTYAAAGAVEVTEEETAGESFIHARIEGTQLYEVEVCLEDGELDGECDCAHAAGGAFCKHLVALCLVWRERLAGHTTTVDETARRKVQSVVRGARTKRDRRNALHEFLRAQPAAALAERLIDLGEQFSEIERMLRLWQQSTAAVADPKALRAVVTDALTLRGRFLPLGEVHRWVSHAEPILPLLRQTRARDARAAANLTLHALRRAWTVLNSADDSNGEIGGFCRAIADEWIESLRASGAQPAAFGDTWLAVQLEDPFGCVDEDAIEEVMGVAALARYRKSLAAAWEHARATLSESASTGKRAPRRIADDEPRYRLDAVERLYVRQLERMNDLDGVLAVLRSDLSTPHRYLDVTRFLEEHNRMREAFANAEEAWRRFPHDHRIEDDLLRAYERDGWFNEAHALRRRQFEGEPSPELYGLALESGVRAGLDRETLRTELYQFMEQLETERMRAPPPRFAHARADDTAGKRNVSSRAQVLLAEGRADEALALVQPPAVCHPFVLRELALTLGADRYDAAVVLLKRVFVLAMRNAQTPYRNELELVRQIVARQDPDARARWLAELRVEFKPKRNFIAGLPP